MTDGAEGALAPDEAFALVGHETRFAVLRALWESEGHRATFSALRERVGVSDSGRFNYHLGKLVGSFVRRVDAPVPADGRSGTGYELTAAGEAVMGAVLSGAYTTRETVGPVAVTEPCPLCGGALTARFEVGSAHVDCGDCDTTLGAFPLSPAALADHASEELPAVLDRYTRVLLRSLDAGFCPVCDGRVDGSLVLHPTGEAANVSSDETADPTPDGEYTCRRCRSEFHTALAFLLEQSSVREFHRARGVDPDDRPFWTFGWLFGEREVTVLDADAPRVRVVVSLDDDRLSLTVGPDLSSSVDD
jgi:hypothetical protein